MRQYCKGRGFLRPISLTTCRTDGQPPGATDVDNPIISYFKPEVIQKVAQKDMLRKNCPDYDPNTPLCCNDDQAEILKANFIQIDTVFGLDCPICAVNIKRMWCEYTCNPNKANFVKGLGYQIDSDPIVGNETLTQFTLDPDYACTLFQSCQKVSLIAQASL